MARNQRLGSPETQGWREQQINDKILHDILLCSYISALPNYHQRLPPAIDGSRYREPQSDVLWERGLKLEVSIGFLPLEKKVKGKIVGVKEHGGHQENIAH